jgi:hypothetical protein
MNQWQLRQICQQNTLNYGWMLAQGRTARFRVCGPAFLGNPANTHSQDAGLNLKPF